MPLFLRLSRCWREALENKDWEDVCLPYEVLTPLFKSMIGATYKTASGSTLTIKGAVQKRDRKAFVLECSSCSKDEELWYQGSIISDRSRLNNGIIPCGCGILPKFNKKQKDILFDRYAKRCNYKLINKNSDNWLVSCHVCSEDEELWPLNSIKVNYKHVLRGNPVCGCNSQVNWTRRQCKLLAERYCKANNYIFLGFEDNKPLISNRIQVFNPITENTWFASLYASITKEKQDPSLEGERLSVIKTLPDEIHIKDFIDTGSFPEGYIFKKNKIKTDKRNTKDYWDCYCPYCSDIDNIYVKNGCCRIFTSMTSSLKRGILPCRCSKNHKYSEDEAKVLSKITCEHNNGRFINIIGDYNGIDKVKIKWLRPDDIVAEVLLRDLRRGKTGLNPHGFDPSKPASIYITRWYGYCESYLKFGITNRDVKVRVSEQDSASKHLDYEILYEGYSDDGGLIQDIERKCKQSLNTGACSEKLLPDGYTETVYDTEDNLNSLLQIINSYLNTQ